MYVVMLFGSGSIGRDGSYVKVMTEYPGSHEYLIGSYANRFVSPWGVPGGSEPATFAAFTRYANSPARAPLIRRNRPRRDDKQRNISSPHLLNLEMYSAGPRGQKSPVAASTLSYRVQLFLNAHTSLFACYLANCLGRMRFVRLQFEYSLPGRNRFMGSPCFAQCIAQMQIGRGGMRANSE